MTSQFRMGKKLLLLSLVGIALPLLLLYTLSFSRSHPPTPDQLNKESGPSQEPAGFTQQIAPPTAPSRQTALAQHVWRTCEDKNMAAPARFSNPDLYDHILVNDEYKVLYCYVPKVACTNWRRVLLVLSGKVKVNSTLDLKAADVHGKYKRLLTSLSDYSPQQAQYRIDNYYKFMFVREPFERLLSAWRNKFQSNQPTAKYFHSKFGQNIIERFRDQSDTATSAQQSQLPSNNMAQALNQNNVLDSRLGGEIPPLGVGDASAKTTFNQTELGGGAGSARRRRSQEGTRVDDSHKVRLDEFLMYLVDQWRKEPLNEHWDKFHRLCQPCSLHYDFVGRYETIEQDAQHVLHALHADDVVAFPHRSATYKHNKTVNVVSDAFKDIDPALLRRVYKSFKADFDLFDYQVPADLWQLMNMGKKGV